MMIFFHQLHLLRQKTALGSSDTMTELNTMLSLLTDPAKPNDAESKGWEDGMLFLKAFFVRWVLPTTTLGFSGNGISLWFLCSRMKRSKLTAYVLNLAITDVTSMPTLMTCSHPQSQGSFSALSTWCWASFSLLGTMLVPSFWQPPVQRGARGSCPPHGTGAVSLSPSHPTRVLFFGAFGALPAQWHGGFHQKKDSQVLLAEGSGSGNLRCARQTHKRCETQTSYIAAHQARLHFCFIQHHQQQCKPPQSHSVLRDGGKWDSGKPFREHFGKP